MKETAIALFIIGVISLMLPSAGTKTEPNFPKSRAWASTMADRMDDLQRRVEALESAPKRTAKQERSSNNDTFVVVPGRGKFAIPNVVSPSGQRARIVAVDGVPLHSNAAPSTLPKP